MRILIVDDSRAMRMLVQRQLRHAGFGDAEIIEATNGAEGFATAEAKAPDLVLSDWNMPEMNGLEMLKALREEGNKVDFGFVTSESTPEMRHLAAEAGAMFLIGKPFTADDFRNALSAVGA